MKKQIFISIKSFLIFTLICSVVYPSFIWLFGLVACPIKADGSLVKNDQGKILGSTLIAQAFVQDTYFQPRPSAAGTNGYDASNSSASNLGATSKTLLTSVTQRAIAYRFTNQINAETPLPPDAVLGSGSGLDPHISVVNAMLQAPRIAKARNMDADTVKKLIQKLQEKPLFGLLGEPCVNVLKLNLSLDGS